MYRSFAHFCCCYWVEFLIYFGDSLLIRYIIVNYFLPFRRLYFHFVDGFLCSAGVFQFGEIPLVYFCFCRLCFGVLSKKTKKQTNSMSRNCSLCCLLVVLLFSLLKYKFICFNSYVEVFSLKWFLIWFEIKAQSLLQVDIFQTLFIEGSIISTLCIFGAIVKGQWTECISGLSVLFHVPTYPFLCQSCMAYCSL